MSKIVLVTEASSGLGALAARALADAGHTVYAGTGETGRRLEATAAAAEAYSRKHAVRLHPLSLQLIDQRSVDTAVRNVVSEAGRIDVVVHNAGPATTGPAEAFTPFQLTQIHDDNVLSTQRVNRAVLPQMRTRREGLVVWVGPSAPDGDAPSASPFSAVRAAVDQLARGYARELAPFGVETSIVTSAAFPAGTSGPAQPVRPDDTETADAYAHEPGASTGTAPAAGAAAEAGCARLTPVDAHTAQALLTLAAAERGRRPAFVTVEPPETAETAEEWLHAALRGRWDFPRDAALSDLLTPWEAVRDDVRDDVREADDR